MKNVVILLCLSFLCLLTACDHEEIASTVSNEQIVSMVSKESTYIVGASDIHVVWKNKSDRELQFGLAFSIEIKEGGKWKVFNPGLSAEKVGEPVAPNAQREHTYHLSQLENKLKVGKYRICTFACESDFKDLEKYPLYAEFSVVN